ncbi:hypothetical protein [Brachyspira hampsonii]|uniref:Uncharacterized protein n=2 Tax=Brachyspira hampsonii TaxID=1287055 RepID=A0A2U4FN18_9SPIR|nr:hypothetical protein [Brachyspira hampsonii]EKV56533.1 hypothetical protein A966_10692 [Brachyspira hampsonii 30446]MBW5390277.1 hypothetical protein [Brachyspira hampsonii]OEJ20130.1 hypothetical protein A9495_00085 [Brachyspira hampsonii]
MIVATVQGKDKGPHDTVLDGKKITGEEQQKAINNLLSKLPPKEITGDDISLLNNKEFFCSMIHPEKDVEGRYRIVLIVWDKNTSEEVIKETIEGIGCDYNRFSQIRSRINNKKKTSKKTFIIIGVIVIAALIMILKK